MRHELDGGSLADRKIARPALHRVGSKQDQLQGGGCSQVGARPPSSIQHSYLKCTQTGYLRLPALEKTWMV